MKPFHSALVFVALLLAACVATPKAPTVTPISTSVPTPIPSSIPPLRRGQVLRIAVLGEATTTNVWKLFDEPGTDYWNYASQVAYWPSLYQLAPLSLDFEPATAKGEPSPISCDASVCTATVTLRPNLTWSDGSSFTARDVAFTINTVLQFELGLNWQKAYDPEVIDHAEAVDDSTVRFYFKTTPGVVDWQYSILQGPIVNRAYWQPRIATSTNLLPDETLLPTIQELEQEISVMQARVDELNLSLNQMAPASFVYQDTTKEIQRLVEELNSVANKISKNRTEYEKKLAEAQTALFSLPNAQEPTLGPWKFASRVEGVFENQANLGTPFGDPWFDSVRYITYSNEAAAVEALLDNDVDLILTPDGLSQNAVSQLAENPKITLSSNATHSARFLAFNHSRDYLADPVLHQALACVIDFQMLVKELDYNAAPLPGYLLDDFWRNPQAVLPCSDLNDVARRAKAVELLKAADYSWNKEPVNGETGSGLKAPDGTLLPQFTILIPLQTQDDLRVKAAEYIVQQADFLGLNVTMQQMDQDDLLYAVYGSKNYDMALLGWRLSDYPSYLCEWFIPLDHNLFVYNESRIGSACDAWRGVSTLELARAYAFDIQSILSQNLPLIPLYTVIRFDAYRNVHYPFTSVVDGLGGLYGAPLLAIPNP